MSDKIQLKYFCISLLWYVINSQTKQHNSLHTRNLGKKSRFGQDETNQFLREAVPRYAAKRIQFSSFLKHGSL